MGTCTSRPSQGDLPQHKQILSVSQSLLNQRKLWVFGRIASPSGILGFVEIGCRQLLRRLPSMIFLHEQSRKRCWSSLASTYAPWSTSSGTNDSWYPKPWQKHHSTPKTPASSSYSNRKRRSDTRWGPCAWWSPWCPTSWCRSPSSDGCWGHYHLIGISCSAFSSHWELRLPDIQ